MGDEESFLLKMLYLQPYSVYLNFAGGKIAAETRDLKGILSLPSDCRFYFFSFMNIDIKMTVPPSLKEFAGAG